MYKKITKALAINAGKALLVLFFLIFNNRIYAQDQNGPVDNNLTDEQLEAYSIQARNSITDFAGHVKNIADKTISTYLRKKYISNALLLFSDPDVNKVEVTSIRDKRNIERPSTRQYLYRLMNLAYKQVNVVWYDIRINNFVKGKDGNYYGTATIIQKFEGYFNDAEHHKVNRDFVRKNVQVTIVKKYNTYSGAKNIDEWELKLGDIKVATTPDE